MLGQAESNKHPWHSRARWAFAVFAIIGVFFIVAEHRAHVLPWLPWLFLAACPFMHFFMHHGHGGHDHRNGGGAACGPPNASPGPDPTGLGSTSQHHHGDK